MDWLFSSIGEWISATLLGSIFDGLDPAMLAFLCLGVIGAVLLIISFILDGIFDAFDFGGDGPLSLTTIAAFVSIFGFSALAASSSGLNSNWASLVGAAVGVAGSAGAFVLTRSMKNIEAPSREESSLAGLYGIVTTPIPSGGLGEVAIMQSGDRIHMSARAEGPVPTGKKVLIESVISSGSVFVSIPAQSDAPVKDPDRVYRSSMETGADFD